MEQDENVDGKPWQPIELVPALLQSSRNSVWNAGALLDVETPLEDAWSILSAEARLLVEKSRASPEKRTQNSFDASVDSAAEALAPTDGLSLSWQSLTDLRSFGLKNLGNTCYVNSVLQVLLHSPPLVSLLLSSDRCKSRDDVGCFNIVRAFAQLCAQMRLVRPANANTLAPTNIIRHLSAICRRYRVGKQEDAHEFLRYFLDKLSTAMQCTDQSPNKRRQCSDVKAVDRNGSETSWIIRIFGGLLRNRIICQTCQHISQRTERFLDLSLDIRQATSVPKSLERYTASELLTGRDRYHCPRCRCYRDAEKRMGIRQAPVILTLHLKRFAAHRKLSNFVGYPEWIDLGPYMIEESRSRSVRYRLYGVIIHEGHSLHSGHYYAFVRTASGTWLRCNDEHISRVGVGVALGLPAYLVFYLRVPASENGSAFQTADGSTADPRPEPNASAPVTASYRPDESPRKRARATSPQRAE
jgi:ubiquitin carboxyl-terminal hydrolase 36/42